MIHGGDVISYKDKYNGDIIDFSSNINPLGPPLGLREEMNRAYSELTAYPDIHYRELKESIAAYLGCGAGEVITGNGALEIINNVCVMFNRTVVFTPCFSEYMKRPVVLGREVIKLHLNDEFEIDIEKLEVNLKPKDLLILGNPNNPTGLRISEQILRRIYDVVIQKNAFLLLDEAFFEFCPTDYDSVKIFQDAGNICVIRAATKFFALPGIRLGYGFAAHDFAEKYGRIESPWSVNSYANGAGRVIFRENDYIKNTKEYIKREREYLSNMLSEIEWIKAYRSDANFILIKLLKYDEDIVFNELIKNGIMIRKASSFEGLDNSYIRIAVKDRKSNNKLIRLFKEFE
ncbi:MAG: aminotransferase class I/II-fold pyridoxal phosphate-dependent enzyme [Clostridiaceae bacterium]|nr:aminotransferase class I/II-fold pyridoxal phosphate-dependent enzyme [Clostridiaceae bacterium]